MSVTPPSFECLEQGARQALAQSGLPLDAIRVRSGQITAAAQTVGQYLEMLEADPSMLLRVSLDFDKDATRHARLQLKCYKNKNGGRSWDVFGNKIDGAVPDSFKHYRIQPGYYKCMPEEAVLAALASAHIYAAATV